ncbi:hypothetical protein [Herbaspirillum rhizosphaerae]|uniref:hypothetical protein n=1 Tax=Herbaspirillum rhizosphaerae TaxID=346179 RepID=UPI00067DE96F|nr:hypothetical protein [Herbaspirillum rhizosphaerae]
MRNLPKSIAILTSVAVIAILALPAQSQWDAFAFAAAAAMTGLGLLYPWALSRETTGIGRSARRDMQEVDVGPATTALLF